MWYACELSVLLVYSKEPTCWKYETWYKPRTYDKINAEETELASILVDKQKLCMEGEIETHKDN